MIIDVYLIKDQNHTTITSFTSKYKASDFLKYNKGTEIEHITMYLPKSVDREVHHINLKEENAPVVKTMKQMVDAHISYTVFEVCNGIVDKAARMLDMSPTNLRHKLKQMDR